MSLTRRFSVAGLSAVMITVIAGALFASSALAQPALPFKAYGSGLKAGQVVEAFKGTTSVGKATVDAAGNWSIDIQPGGAAAVAAGDRITMKLDGRDVAQTVTFASGQFPAPPGIALTVGAAATPAPLA